MFLTKKDIEYSLEVLELLNRGETYEEIKLAVANKIAGEIFESFEEMHQDEQVEILDMMLEDMSFEFYPIN